MIGWWHAVDLFSFHSAWKLVRRKTCLKRNYAKPASKAWAAQYAKVRGAKLEIRRARNAREKEHWKINSEYRAKKRAAAKAYRERSEIKEKQRAYMVQWKAVRDADPIRKEQARVRAIELHAKPEYKETRRKWVEDNAAYLKEARRERRRAHIAEDPLYERKQGLKKKYGISFDEWNEIFEEQGLKCACCDRPFAGEGFNTWHIDHDHVTDEIRGIICHFCNNTLGRLGDNEEGVVASCVRFLKYLRRKREA